MSSIGKNDHVLCVLGHNNGEVVLVEGQLYVVDEIDPFHGIPCGLHGEGSECFGLRTKTPVLGSGLFWCGKRFVPILKYKEHQFDYMLVTDDVKKPAFVCEEV